MEFRSLQSLLLIVLFNQHVAAYKPVFWRNQFQHWYPSVEPVFEYIRDKHCRNEFNLYLHGNGSTPFNVTVGGESNNRLVQPLMECLLENTSEFTKSNMASAQVLLGLTPGILSILGPSIEEIATLWVIGRRRFLTLLIVGGAPAVFPERAFKFESPTKILQCHEGPVYSAKWGTVTELTILMIEYLVTMISVANLFHTCYLLGVQAICNFASERPYLAILWVCLGIIPHLFGCLVMHVRVKEKRGHQVMSKKQFLKAQFKPITQQPAMNFTVKDESGSLIILSWSASIAIMTYIIFGTLCWSSMVFVGVKDAVGIISRLMVSAVASRSVLVYELSMLRNAHANTPNSHGDPKIEGVRPGIDINKGMTLENIVERPERIRTV